MSSAGVGVILRFAIVGTTFLFYRIRRCSFPTSLAFTQTIIHSQEISRVRELLRLYEEKCEGLAHNFRLDLREYCGIRKRYTELVAYMDEEKGAGAH